MRRSGISLRLLTPAFVLGALAALGQAPLDLWWISLPALAGVVAIVGQAACAKARLALGWVAGCGYFLGSLFWIVEPFMVDAATDGWMAPFALVGLTGGMALFWALAAGFSCLGRSPAGRAYGFALGLVCSDLVRTYVLTGFPWALVGHIWISTPVAQLATFAGPVGLSALTASAAFLAGAAPGGRIKGIAAAGFLVGAAWGFGAWRLAQPEAPRSPAIHVRLVQPNATQALKWQPGMWDVFLDRLTAESEAPAAQPLDLIVWPETSVPYLLEDAGPILASVTELNGHVPLAVGIQRAVGTRYFNSLALTDAGGDVIATYDKHHLVPFGEYVPFGDQLAMFGISAFAAQEGNAYSAGNGPAILNSARAGRILPLICYEAVFPQDLRTGSQRADWILQVTNDGWFGELAGPYQHLAQARLRAIEQGLPLLRAANTGVTAAFDAKGREIGRLPFETVGHLDLAVPPALSETTYAIFGDWINILMILFSLTIYPLVDAKRKWRKTR